jgi:hypothetical protein
MSDPTTGPRPVAAAVVEAEILRLLETRDPASSVCPSEVARSLGGDDWRDLMDPVREVAGRLAADGRVRVTQGGSTVDIASAKGPIRLRRATN